MVGIHLAERLAAVALGLCTRFQRGTEVTAGAKDSCDPSPRWIWSYGQASSAFAGLVGRHEISRLLFQRLAHRTQKRLSLKKPRTAPIANQQMLLDGGSLSFGRAV